MFGRLGLHLNFSVAHAKIPDSRNTQKQYMCICMWFSYICQLTTWHYPHLLLHAMLLQCQQPLWSIDLSCLPGSKQQTHCSSCNVQRLIDETDRRTDARPLNRPCSTCYETHTHTHTHPFNGPLSGTTRVSQYQKGKTNLDFTGARDSEWQWNLLDHMQVCTSLQTDNHANTSLLSFFTGRMPFLPPNQQRQSTEGKNSFM